MRDTFLPFSPPFLGEEEVDEVVAALRSGWISRGPRTAAFEEAFADRVGAPAALALNSCTAGLHLSLLVHGIGPGDEVVVPTMTFCASANVVEHVGARPVLVDVEPDTLTVDPAAVEAALTERTRAVVVVHYAGHPAEMDALERLAADRGVALVEDAAHAVPAAFRDRPVGSRSSLASFSFYATKNLTTGEGGMLTGDPELVERARILGLHGMSRDAWKRYDGEGSWYYEVVAPGYKYNMTDVQAALGLRQLERLDAMQRRRREVVARYEATFGGRPELRTPGEREHVDSSWHLYPLRLTEAAPVGRDAFIRGLTERRIGTSVHYIPLHLHPWYRDRYGYGEEDFPVAQAAYEGLVSLPLHPGLSERDVDDVVEAVAAVLRERPAGC
jgi:dTDP-4-amino-4,6-dideoxygalactose transaminase